MAGGLQAAGETAERVAAAVVDGLRKAIPVVLGLLASFFGLGGVRDAVRKAVADLAAKINAKLEAFAKWVASKVRKLLGVKGQPGAKPGAACPDPKAMPAKPGGAKSPNQGGNTQQPPAANQKPKPGKCFTFVEATSTPDGDEELGRMRPGDEVLPAPED